MDQKLSKDKRTELIDKTILVVSREGCPYCDQMDELLKENKDKIKHKLVTVNMKQDGSRTYNHNYSELNLDDRRNIDTIVEEMLADKSGVAFPTLFKKSEIYLGRPEKEDFNKFFEINI